MFGDEVGQHHVFRAQAVGEYHRGIFAGGLLQYRNGSGNLFVQFISVIGTHFGKTSFKSVVSFSLQRTPPPCYLTHTSLY
jgi:hypothetical protein